MREGTGKMWAVVGLIGLVMGIMAGAVWADPPPAVQEKVEQAFKQLNDPDPKVCVAAVRALSGVNDPRVLPALLKVAKNPEAQVRVAAIGALGGLTSDPRCSRPLCMP